jgi:hypothetical protein
VASRGAAGAFSSASCSELIEPELIADPCNLREWLAGTVSALRSVLDGADEADEIGSVLVGGGVPRRAANELGMRLVRPSAHALGHEARHDAALFGRRRASDFDTAFATPHSA